MRTSQTSRPEGATSWSVLAKLLVLALLGLAVPAVQAASAPPNDNFNNATVIFGSFGMAGGSNVNATVEPGEPLHAANASGMSIWFSWTATVDGYITFDTSGSTFPTALAVYTGDSVAQLSCVGRNVTGAGLLNGGSLVSFLASAGTVYRIAVDGIGGASGSVQLNWSAGQSGHLQWASGYVGNPGGHPLYPVSDHEDVSGNDPGLSTQYSTLGARLTLARTVGAQGRLVINWSITNTFYTNFFFTNWSGTNLFISNSISGGFTNYFTTNIYVSHTIQNYANGQFGTYFCQSGASSLFTNMSGFPPFGGTNTPFVPVGGNTNFCMNTNLTGTDTNGGVFSTNLFCFSTNVTQILPTATFGVDYFPASGTITLEDYQMSADVLINVSPRVAVPGSAANRLFIVNITSAAVDPTDSTNLAEPYFATDTNGMATGTASAFVNVLDEGIDPVTPCSLTNGIINFERATLRSAESVGNSVVYLYRTGNPTNSVSVDVDFDAKNNYKNGGVTGWNHSFPVQAGDDYAVPASSSVIPGNPTDFTPFGTTTVTFPANPNNNPNLNVMPLTIPLLDPVGPALNKDIQLTMSNPQAKGQAVAGYVSTLDLTILPDNSGPLTNSAGATNPPAQAQAAGALDRNFNRDNDLLTAHKDNPNPGANFNVYALAVQPSDGKTLVVGDLTSYDQTIRNHIARLNLDGQNDSTFLASPNSGADAVINSLAIQPLDGKIIIGGQFASFNGTNRHGIARLDTDGSLDGTFSPGAGVVGTVWAVALQQDGKVLIGGDFTSVNNTNRARIARLNTDGSLDTSFGFDPTGTVPLSGPDDLVQAIAVQSDGAVVIGGNFASVNGTNRSHIARLNADGSLDLSFDPGTGADDNIYTLALDSSGNILAGGAFTSLNLAARSSIGRLLPNGSIDTSFNPGTGADGPVYAITLQPDGNILVGGIFSLFNGTRRVGLTRLFPDGTVDTSFLDTTYNQFAGLINYNFNSPRSAVYSIGVQADGNVMIGGSFAQVGAGFYSAFLNFFNASLATAPNASGTVEGSRQEVRNRANVTRLWGGATPGPGNISLVPDDPVSGNYSVDENAGQQFITLQRVNGSNGVAGATFTVFALPAGPGAAVEGPTNDYFFDDAFYGNPYWDTRWPKWAGLYGLDVSDGNSGANNVAAAQFGDPFPEVFVNLRDDFMVDGNHSLAFKLSNPVGGITESGGPRGAGLSGELIPTGVALGADTAAQDVIIESDQLIGQLQFSMASYSVSESGGTALINVIRTNGTSSQINVNFATVDGTAIAGTTNDYIGTNGTLTFGPGVTNRSFSVRIVNNVIAHADRTLNLVLSSPTGGSTLGTPGTATLTIINGVFSPGHVGFTSTNFTAHESDGTATITVARTGGSQNILSVQYYTTDGTAVSPVNYTRVPNSPTNSLTWASGETTPKTFTVPVRRDGLVTPNLTANLFLTNAMVNGVVTNLALNGTTNATLTIINDDSYGSPAFSTPTYTVNNDAGQAIITIVRQGGTAQSITVAYATSDGTATSGVDYDSTSGTLTFGPGQYTQTFPVTIHQNPNTNLTTSLFITLTPITPGGLTVAGANPATLTIVDQRVTAQPPGGVDTTFNPGGTFFNDTVYALMLQPDGGIVAGGDFTFADSIARNRIARLNADGTLDTTFSSASDGADSSVRALARQSDGRILVGGLFSQFNGVNCGHITRLNLDGSLDGSFVFGSGADNPVFAVAETFVPSGTNLVRKILVGGSFASIRGISVNGIAQLNDDGSVDTTFVPAGSSSLGANSTVYAIAVYSTNDINSGKILIGGDFTQVNGVTRYHIARLNPDGSLDTTFDPGPGPNDSVRAIAIQVDGNVVIGGIFTAVGGSGLNHIARLLPNGTVDLAFNPGLGANDVVLCLALQEDLKIVVGGGFTQANGVTRNRLTRLNADGSLDPDINFGLGADAFVAAVVVQPDDLMVLGGGFTTFDGQSAPHIARIYGRSSAGSGAFTFTTSQYQVNENGTNAVITVRRTGGTGVTNGSDVFVTFETSDPVSVPPGFLPGKAGTDYRGVTNVLDFPVGETFASATVPIINNSIIEPDRLLNLSLLNPTNPGAVGPQPTLGVQSQAQLEIINDNSSVSFFASTYSVAKNAVNGAGVISVVRNGSSVGTATVTFETTTNGTAIPFTDYTPVTNTVTFVDGETNVLVSVPINNNGIVEGNQTVSLAISSPSNTILLAPTTAQLTIIDTAQVPGSLMFAQSGYFVDETGTNAVITVLRTNGSLGQIRVNYAANGGTAVPGVNYAPTNGTITFADGVLKQTFLVPVFHDHQVTGNLTVNLTLSSPSGGATIVGPTTVPLTIVDDDIGVSFAQAGYFVDETAGSITIGVQRVGGTNTPFSVNFATTNLTAFAGTNYGASSGTLNFANGQLFQTFNIPIIHDPQVTGNLVFLVNLSSTNGSLQIVSPASTAVTVIDVDSGLAFASPTNSVLKTPTNALITVLRSGSTTGQVMVNFATTGGTAGTSEYVPTNGVLTFADGQTTNTFTVSILNDNAVDGDQTVNLALTSPTGGAQLVAPSNSVLTIIDSTVVLGFSSQNYAVNENGQSAPITVLRSGVTNNTVTVNYATTNGTAHSPGQYTSTSGVLTFTNGQVSQSFNVPIIDNNVTGGSETVLLGLSSPSAPAIVPNPNATLTILNNDGSLIVPSGTALVSESGPTNGVIDPGETVTVLFGLRNNAGSNTVNLVATLLATNGVTPTNLASQTYGVLVTNGPTVSRPFSFKATGTNGGTIAAVFQLQDGATVLNPVTFNFQLGRSTNSFTNSALITINDNAAATPYPSVTTVAGLPGVVTKVSVTVSNVTHSSFSDICLLLVSPSGLPELFMGNVPDHVGVTNLTLTFDDAAAITMPSGVTPTNGNYKPTVTFDFPPFPQPAPAGPYSTSLSGFAGSNPNGNWLLYVLDDVGGDSGIINNGWSLAISTTSPVQPTADLATGLSVAPAAPVVTSNFTYSISVTNFGPAGATNVVVTDILPSGLTFVTASAPGGFSQNSGTVTLNLGNLGTNVSANATLTVTAASPVTITNTILAASDESDPNPGNNTNSLVTTIGSPTADMAIGLADAPDPVMLGGNVTYTITVTNLGPASATSVNVTNTLPSGFKLVSAPGGVAVTNGAVTVTWSLGSLGSGGTATLTLVAQPTTPGLYTNTVTVGSGVLDPLKGNNIAQAKTIVAGMQLASSRGSGKTLVLTWPSGFDLYSSTNILTPLALWTKVTNPAPQLLGNGSNTVTISTATGSQFFQFRSTGP